MENPHKFILLAPPALTRLIREVADEPGAAAVVGALPHGVSPGAGLWDQLPLSITARVASFQQQLAASKGLLCVLPYTSLI